MKPNWKLIASDVTAALTMLSLVPYDRDTMSIIGSVIPETWLPYVVKAGIASTLVLRLWDRYFPHQQQPTETVNVTVASTPPVAAGTPISQPIQSMIPSQTQPPKNP